MGTRQHPTAVIDPSAELGELVEVGPYAVIGAKVTIGDGTVVGAQAQVQGPTILGRENRIFPYAAVGFDPQDLKYKQEETWLEIGDRNQFREFSTVNRGTVGGGGRTVVGSDNLFMTGTHIAHDCVVGSRTVFANNGTLAGHVEVQDDATVGAFVSMHQRARIGKHAYTGGYSILNQDVLPFSLTVGAKPKCYGINRVGLSRKGFGEEKLARLEAAFRILLRSGLNTSDAVARLEAEDPDENVRYLIDFIESSERGFSKGKRKGTRGGD